MASRASFFGRRINQPSSKSKDPKPQPSKKPAPVPGESRYVVPKNRENWTSFSTWQERRRLKVGKLTEPGLLDIDELVGYYERIPAKVYQRNAVVRKPSGQSRLYAKEGNLYKADVKRNLGKLKCGAPKKQTRRQGRGADDIQRRKVSFKRVVQRKTADELETLNNERGGGAESSEEDWELI